MRVLATHSIRQFPLHFPFRASPCATSFRTSSTYYFVFIFFLLYVCLCLYLFYFVPLCVLLFLCNTYFLPSFISSFFYSIVLLKPYFPTSGCTIICLRKSTESDVAFKASSPMPFLLLKELPPGCSTNKFTFVFLLVPFSCWSLGHPFPILTPNHAKCCAVVVLQLRPSHCSVRD